MADAISRPATISVSYRVCSMRFVPQGHGGKMFVGGIGAEQSADFETSPRQKRILRRQGLHRSWLIALLGLFSLD